MSVSDPKMLVVYWDPEDNNRIHYDAEGLSVFDVAGMLATALGIAEALLPSVWDGEDSQED